MSSSVQYHFVSQTASTFNVCVVAHLALAILSSIFDIDVSAALAVMGIVAVLNYNIGLLFLYIIFTPCTVFVDIFRIIAVKSHYSQASTGFFAFCRVVEMLVKVAATFFGYQVYTSASEVDSGYEQINGGPSQGTIAGPGGFQPPGHEQKSNPFVPASYTAPPMVSGPVVQSSVPPPSTI